MSGGFWLFSDTLTLERPFIKLIHLDQFKVDRYVLLAVCLLLVLIVELLRRLAHRTVIRFVSCQSLVR